MSKTIDVEAVDTWTVETKEQPFFLQHRNGKHRQVSRSTVSRWYDNCVEWPPISSWVAVGILDAWGYTITTPAAKDEAPAKTEPTLDVPMVGDIWVEHDGVLSGYSQWNKMHALHGYEIRNGTARIVRLAADPDLAATVKRVEERLEKVETNANYVNGEYSALDTDLKALAETVNAVREAATKNAMYCNELERRVAKLEAVIAEAQSLLNESPKAATTTAKVRVVLPEMPGRFVDEQLISGWCLCIEAVKRTLSAAGVEVKEASK